MKIQGATALVTGTNRGIGRNFVMALVNMGAAKVYAAARDTAGVADLFKAYGGKVVPVQLDVTNDAQVAAAAQKCGDVSLLINNAGANGGAAILAASDMNEARREMEVNYFGLQSMCRAFAPVLKKNGGGAMVNLLSVVSRINIPMLGSYCASKAAAWSLTQAVRAELAAQGTLVVGIFPGAVDTDMAKGVDMPKLNPLDVAKIALGAVESGAEDVDVGEMSQGVAAMVTHPKFKEMEKQFAAYLPGAPR
jgi:NAD(P)-dependent dehydrogenase (short-subunit alcohol dehydrogenase family)